MKTIKLLAMALVACMALCSLPVPLTIPVIPAHTPLPAICAQEAPKAIDLGVCVKWAAKDIGPEADIPEGWRLPEDFWQIAVILHECF